MKHPPKPACECHEPLAMAAPLALDELMIVNPARADEELYIGEDGMLYGLQGARGKQRHAPAAPLFLARDGTVYRAEPSAPGKRTRDSYLLAADGVLYQIRR